jgi:hypothetical protein
MVRGAMVRRLALMAAFGAWATAMAVASGTPAAPRLLSETGLYVSGDLKVLDVSGDLKVLDVSGDLKVSSTVGDEASGRGGLQASGTGDLLIDPRNRPFSPQYPLWTDGAQKRRWVRLPEGATIDARNVDAWQFPAGTRFWKEFSFGGRKVETRMLWKAGEDANDWVLASYVWNDAQTDAVLAPAEGVLDVADVAPGKRHSIPGVSDCRACHDGSRTEVLGFSALQLSTDRDPGALHSEPLADGMITLKTLVDDNVLRPHRPELVTNPPRIAAENPLTRSVLGYLSSNCGHCHNAESSVANGNLNLRQLSGVSAHPHDADIAAAWNRRTSWQIPGLQGSTLLAKPGVPGGSALLQRMRSRRPSSQMPPLGTVVADREAVELVERWVQALP